MIEVDDIIYESASGFLYRCLWKDDVRGLILVDSLQDQDDPFIDDINDYEVRKFEVGKIYIEKGKLPRAFSGGEQRKYRVVAIDGDHAVVVYFLPNLITKQVGLVATSAIASYEEVR